MSEKSNIKILDIEASDNLCTQYMEKKQRPDTQMPSVSKRIK